MNFLAHLYLSGEDIEIRLGNFIGDYVKGKTIFSYPKTIQKGINLHRAIDFHTDKHSSWKICRELLKESYGRWAGVVTDVMFDYILAKEWENYSNRPLKGFTRTFYFQMLQRYHLLPPRVRGFLPFMIHSNRLYSYRSDSGIIKALNIMSNHTSLQGDPEQALNVVKDNYELLREKLNKLLSDLTIMVEREFQIQPSMRHIATYRSVKG
ncbi:acyl carrier protein phosphodiesterase [Tenuifilum thalassicum]|uniref:DUF479 domain-containing protein n=1 Tax=Tenuifilum thalassicum TaxID=2590900 RepID=A0A7D3XU26_9BACT|nr:ACP phosphodiesterase [Tenuifilum thalassicum]QKG79291.1 DUF479 domain-containing protein [Tenuifilum thalassicum]